MNLDLLKLKKVSLEHLNESFYATDCIIYLMRLYLYTMQIAPKHTKSISNTENRGDFNPPFEGSQSDLSEFEFGPYAVIEST